MKVAAITNAKKIEVKEVAEPTAGNGNVLIDVKYAGICGSDIHYWELGQPQGMVMGHEFSGVVTDPGSRTDLKAGDRVTGLPISPCGHCEPCMTGNPQYCRETWSKALGLSLDCPGAFAPKIFVRPDMVVKVPDNVSDEEAAMVEPAAVGLHAVHLGDIKVGDTVLVVGGGIIGLVSALFAKLDGAKQVVVSETNPARGKNAVKLKVADAWLDAKDPNFVANAYQISNGGFDCVIECCGNTPAVQSALMTVKPGKRVILAGVSLTPIAFPSALAVTGEFEIRGAIGYTKEEFVTCLDLIAMKKINLKPFMSKVVGLDAVQASFEELTNGQTASIKILVDPRK